MSGPCGVFNGLCQKAGAALERAQDLAAETAGKIEQTTGIDLAKLKDHNALAKLGRDYNDFSQQAMDKVVMGQAGVGKPIAAPAADEGGQRSLTGGRNAPLSPEAQKRSQAVLHRLAAERGNKPGM